MRGMGRVYVRGHVWWVQYYFNGRKHRESAGSPSRPDAMRLLCSRLEEIGRGRLVGPAMERTTFDDLAESLLTDYRINRKRSIARIEDSVEHLRRVFTGFRAMNVTSDRIMAYIGARQKADAANGTINRELSALRRMISCSLSSRGSPNRSGIGSENVCAQAKPALELRASTSDVGHGWLTWKKSDAAVWLDRAGDSLQKR